MTEKEKEMVELLKEAKRLLKLNFNYIEEDVGETSDLMDSIDNVLKQLELEEIEEKFAYLYRVDKNGVLIRSIKKRDKIEFVKDYGFYDFIKPIIEKYWDNMDELFDKLEEIYLKEEGEEKNE